MTKPSSHGFSNGFQEGANDLTRDLLFELLHRLNNVLSGLYFNIDVCQDLIAQEHPAKESAQEIFISAQEIQRVVERMTDIMLSPTEVESTYHELGALVSGQLDLIRLLLPKTSQAELRTPTHPLYVHLNEPEFRTILLMLTRSFYRVLTGKNPRIAIKVGTHNDFAFVEKEHPEKVEPTKTPFPKSIQSQNGVAVILCDETGAFEAEAFGHLHEAQFLAAKHGGWVGVLHPASETGPCLALLLPQITFRE